MSTETAVTTEAPAASNGKPAAKKAPTKKPTAAGGYELRKPQVAVLKCLAKASKPLSRAEIATKADTDQAFLSTWIGSSDDKVRNANDKKRGVKALLTLKYVRDEQLEGEPVKYVITAAGKAALAKVS